jgi:hypothetical protein
MRDFTSMPITHKPSFLKFAIRLNRVVKDLPLAGFAQVRFSGEFLTIQS